jgi:hypothetical protein
MANDLLVVLEDRPGTLAEMGEVLGDAGINIEGICAVTYKGEGAVHILVDDPAAAKKALSASGISVLSERDVLVMEIADNPGELGKKANALTAAGVNIELVYLATGTRLVLGVDDLEGAKKSLKI